MIGYRIDITEYDELNVNMYWENIDSFTAWRNSDAFKSAHKRPEPGSEAEKKESPILGSEIITYKVASVKKTIGSIRQTGYILNPSTV